MKYARRACFFAVGALALAACSDESSNKGEPQSTDVVVTTVAVAATDPTVVDESTTTTVADVTDVVHNPATGEFVGAVEDVTAQTCDKEADGWRVTGTATNPTGDAVDYRIYVSLLDGASATRALVETEVLAVAASAAGTFDVLIPIPDDDLRCVLRVERRAPGT
ncbi:MAG: hypothetical protein K8R99_08095 [Actinomycetia bacterium]|nr:hypothetical protein [Actinomycetes bacterium]